MLSRKYCKFIKKFKVTSELHGTDNRDDKLAWSQTEVRKRSPAWMRVR